MSALSKLVYSASYGLWVLIVLTGWHLHEILIFNIVLCVSHLRNSLLGTGWRGLKILINRNRYTSQQESTPNIYCFNNFQSALTTPSSKPVVEKVLNEGVFGGLERKPRFCKMWYKYKSRGDVERGWVVEWWWRKMRTCAESRMRESW
jgi:hypothetical protein